jgi:endonuclease YncB( thermonuclease family)
MRIGAMALGLAGLAGVVLLLVGDDPPQDNLDARTAPSESARPEAEVADRSPPAPARPGPPVQPPRLPDAPLPDTIRNVTPADILPPPPVRGPLKRVEAKLPEQPKVEVPDDLTFRRPLVLDAGTLRHKTLTIRLAGLDAPEVSETCPSRLGGSWPCGRRARTALRAFVRRRAITCDQISEVAPGLIAAQCRRQDTDLSEWMIAQGWARPADDAPEALREAGDAARAKRKGIWQLDWRGDLDRRIGAGPETSATAIGTDPETGEGTDGDTAAGSQDASLEGLLGDVEIVDTPWHPDSGETDDAPDRDASDEAPAGLPR